MPMPRVIQKLLQRYAGLQMIFKFSSPSSALLPAVVLGVLAASGCRDSAREILGPGEPDPRGAAPRSGTLRVPLAYGSIQEAIDAAMAGDVVLVAPGEYFENLVLRDGIVLRSETRPEETIIHGSGSGHVIDCVGVTASTVVRGFTITGGGGVAFGGGIRCWQGASPVIERNIITGNSADYGGGIAARYESFPVILRNQILLNHARLEGAGVYAIDGQAGEVSIRGNTIRSNSTTADHAAGGGIWIGGINATIDRNRIEDNRTTFAGGGIWAGFSGRKTIEKNDIFDNSCLDYGGGIWVDQGWSLITMNDFSGNSGRVGPDIGAGNLGTKIIIKNRFH